MKSVQGYKLVPKITFYSKNVKQEYLPTFATDSENKAQKETAYNWAQYWEYGEMDPVTKTYPNKKSIEPIITELDNSGFKFTISDCAQNSSQGGKLSFWNCKLEKEGHKFLIGINSALLLEVLKEGTFEKGVCKEPVCIVSKNGQTGVCIENGNIYNKAKQDMQIKSTINSSKTTKYNYGDFVSTVTLNEIYVGELYRYYKVDKVQDYFSTNGIYTITKLQNPEKVFVFCNSINTKVSECLNKQYKFNVYEKKPQRFVNQTNCDECNLTKEQLDLQLSNLYNTYAGFEKFGEIYKGWNYTAMFITSKFFGIANKPFEFEDQLLTLFKSKNIKLNFQ